MTPGLDLRLAGFRGDNFYPGGVDASPVLDGHEGSQSLRDPAVPSETKWDRGRIYMNLLQFGVFFFVYLILMYYIVLLIIYPLVIMNIAIDFFLNKNSELSH